MQNNDVTVFLQKLAEREGLTENEIRNEIALAISYALKSSDPNLQNFWKNFPSLSKDATIDDIIDYLVIKIAEQNK
jgi:hypothetical protein